MPLSHHPQSSPEYRKLRQELHAAEVALRDQRERVAELRRALPRETPSEDYVFETLANGVKRSIRLSELFDDPEKPLILMQFMYGKAQKNACPMCTMWADGYAGTLEHLARRTNFAVLIAGDVEELDRVAKGRGWGDLRIVSAADSTIKSELGFESGDGAQMPGVSVFEKSANGGVVHFYSVCAVGSDGPRMMDLLSPVWNFLDLAPEGRGDFMPQLKYDG